MLLSHGTEDCPPNFAYHAETDTCVRDCPPGTVWQPGYFAGDFFIGPRCVTFGTPQHPQQNETGKTIAALVVGGLWIIVAVILITS